MSLWFVDMNQRTKKPGLWSASWCASCASCGLRFSASAVVLMGQAFRSAYWFVRLATSGLFGAGATFVRAAPGTAGAGGALPPALLLAVAGAGAAAGVAPGILPPFDPTQAA